MLSNLKRRVVGVLKAEDGSTAVEYAVMLALIIVVCIAAIATLGSNASNTFSYVGNTVNTASSRPPASLLAAGFQRVEHPPMETGPPRSIVEQRERDISLSVQP